MVSPSANLLGIFWYWSLWADLGSWCQALPKCGCLKRQHRTQQLSSVSIVTMEPSHRNMLEHSMPWTALAGKHQPAWFFLPAREASRHAFLKLTRFSCTVWAVEKHSSVVLCLCFEAQIGAGYHQGLVCCSVFRNQAVPLHPLPWLSGAVGTSWSINWTIICASPTLQRQSLCKWRSWYSRALNSVRRCRKFWHVFAGNILKIWSMIWTWKLTVCASWNISVQPHHYPCYACHRKIKKNTWQIIKYMSELEYSPTLFLFLHSKYFVQSKSYKNVLLGKNVQKACKKRSDTSILSTCKYNFFFLA